jgi:hypothetical protein
MRTIMMLGLAALLMINAAPALAADTTDHAAIAEEYAKEAADAEAKAAHHDKMAQSYRGGGKLGQFHAEDHCKAIAKRYREQAKDLNALANAERTAAKASSK